MAELLGGSTIAGYPVLHSGLKEAYLAGNLTLGGKIYLGIGSTNGIKGYLGDGLLVDHGNGNVTMGASGGQLYLGYDNTTTVRLYKNLVYGTGSLIADTAGKLYYQTNDIDGRYLKLTGGSMGGTLTLVGGLNVSNMEASFMTDLNMNGGLIYSVGELQVSTVTATDVQTSSLGVTGMPVIAKTGGQLLNLKQTDSASGLYNYIGFADSAGAWKSYVGYSASKDGHFRVNSATGNIVIDPHTGFSTDFANKPLINIPSIALNDGAVIKILNMPAIQFTSNGASTSGYGMRIGADGMTVVGAGQAVNAAYNGYIADKSANPESEELLLASDNSVRVYTNLNSGWTDVAGTNYKSEFIFHDYGYLVLPGGRGNGSPTSTAPGGRVLDMGAGYNWYVDNTGAGTANNRAWLDAPAQGEVIIGPRGSTDYLDQVRIKGNHIWLNTDGGDTAAGNRKGVTIGPGYNSGVHMQLDGNEIGAFNGTTPSNLILNAAGGDVSMGTSTSSMKFIPGNETSVRITNTNAVSGSTGNVGLELRAEGNGLPYLDFVRGTGDYTKRLIVDSNNNFRVDDGITSEIVSTHGETDWWNPPASGWYCIAYNGTQLNPTANTGGDRAYGTFTIMNADASRHMLIHFTAGTAFNKAEGVNLKLLGKVMYGSIETFGGIRIMTRSTYDIQYLEVYIEDTAAIRTIMKDNYFPGGWKLLTTPVATKCVGTHANYTDNKLEMQPGYEGIPRNLISGTVAPPNQGMYKGDVYVQY